jgi:hypothetical protein
VYQVEGEWYGWNSKELKTCVLDVYELKVGKEMILPHHYEAAGRYLI